MDPAVVIPNYETAFPLKDDHNFRRPSNLTVSTTASWKSRSPDSSPTKSRFRQGSDGETGIIQGPFMYVGPQRKRFHAQRNEAPYPIPCGLEELSRYNSLYFNGINGMLIFC